MKLEEIVETSASLARTRSRLEKADLIAKALSKAGNESLSLVVSYLSGLTPQGRVGIGHASLQMLGGVEPAKVSSLTLADVDTALNEYEQTTGARSSARRAELLRELYRKATPDEQSFLSRLFIGDLRQGSLEGSMVEAVAKAADVPSADVRRALMFSGDLGAVAKTAMYEGTGALARYTVEPLRPVRPMLAQTAEDVADALDTLGRAALEYKLDGARIQVHKTGSEVRVFTRRSNDVTHACPEVVESIRELEAESVILDGEAIALRKDGRPHPFQTTMSRFGRRLDVASMRRALPLTSIYFDCLLQDGEPLVDLPESERFDRLKQVLPGEHIVPRLVTESVEEGRSFVERAMEAGHEGVMVKNLDAPYEAGSRGKAWLKVKAAHTLDLVVLAAEWGSGRRKGWLSNLHLGARDEDSGRFVMLGKTFKGMTDTILEWQTMKLQELETSREEWTVFVRPELVVEIAFNDIQKSPHYPGGLALRFARLKSYREDKSPDEADTIETVRQVYQRQTGELPDESERQLSLLPLDGST